MEEDQGARLIVVLDSNGLVAWSSSDEVDDDRSRLAHLFEAVSKANGKLIIPTPSLAEYLVKTDEATADWLAAIEKKKSIVIGAFDRRAAFECSLLDKSAIGAGDKKGGRLEPWQKIKVDRQIIAIARVHNADLIVSNDGGLRSTAKSVGMKAVEISELPLPDAARQANLPLEPVIEAKESPRAAG